MRRSRQERNQRPIPSNHGFLLGAGPSAYNSLGFQSLDPAREGFAPNEHHRQAPARELTPLPTFMLSNPMRKIIGVARIIAAI